MSKLVAQDVPLFLALMKDLFPKVTPPPGMLHFACMLTPAAFSTPCLSWYGSIPARSDPALEMAISRVCLERKLTLQPTWATKIMQLNDTAAVRHGVMLVGPAGAGKTKVVEVLARALTKAHGRVHRIVRMNPKVRHERLLACFVAAHLAFPCLPCRLSALTRCLGKRIACPGNGCAVYSLACGKKQIAEALLTTLGLFAMALWMRFGLRTSILCLMTTSC